MIDDHANTVKTDTPGILVDVTNANFTYLVPYTYTDNLPANEQFQTQPRAASSTVIDDRTPNLALPLPHADNLLTDDVPRLREAFAALDTHATQVEAVIIEALAAATDAAKKALWSGITGKPDAFPPTSHGHTFAELSDTPAVFPPASHGHDWTEVGGKPASYPPAGHDHGWTELTGKPATFTPASHSHAVGEISGTLPTSKGGTGNTSGNAPTASRWQNSRTLSLTGEVSGSVSWDGSSSVSLPVTIAASAKGPMIPTAETFVALFSTGTHHRIALPSGGTWAYFLIPTAQQSRDDKEFSYQSVGTYYVRAEKPTGVLPGGSLVGTGVAEGGYGGYTGFAWRIA